MIAFLKGKLIKINQDNIVVDVGGVGYKVYIHAGLINSYKINDVIELDIHTYVRED
ncbi:Holliday junction branch migration protein RuvA, partial [candidate division WWE3 bacterium]|nr:Holliday junction branch migration protein RuvA [candidate division WWE3 bacterium]